MELSPEEQRVEELPFLPGSLPYQVVSVQGEMAFLPDEAKHRVRIAASDARGPLVEVTPGMAVSAEPAHGRL